MLDNVNILVHESLLYYNELIIYKPLVVSINWPKNSGATAMALLY
jgi:hypothetical protein